MKETPIQYNRCVPYDLQVNEVLVGVKDGIFEYMMYGPRKVESVEDGIDHFWVIDVSEQLTALRYEPSDLCVDMKYEIAFPTLLLPKLNSAQDVSAFIEKELGMVVCNLISSFLNEKQISRDIELFQGHCESLEQCLFEGLQVQFFNSGLFLNEIRLRRKVLVSQNNEYHYGDCSEDYIY